MRARIALLALLLVSGCTLDIARLYGSADAGLDASVPRDGAPLDAPAQDSGPRDAQLPDAHEIDAGPRVLSLAPAATLSVGSGEGLSAAFDGVRGLAVVSRRAEGLLVVAPITGSGCALSFGARIDVALDRPTAPLLVDVDIDGQPDLFAGVADTSIALLIGSGDDFVSGPSFIHGGGPVSAIDAGDLDGDTDLDLLVAAGARLITLQQTSIGTFTSGGGPSGSGVDYSDALLGDLDGDERLDIAGIATGAPTRLVAVRGDGMGSFLGPLLAMVSPDSRSLAFGALDVDGTESVVVAGGRTLWIAQVSSAISATESGFIGTEIADVALAELDRAPGAEIVVIDVATSTLAVLTSRSGALTRELEVGTSPGPRRLAVVDVDSDGIDEVLVLSTDTLTVFSARCMDP